MDETTENTGFVAPVNRPSSNVPKFNVVYRNRTSSSPIKKEDTAIDSISKPSTSGLSGGSESSRYLSAKCSVNTTESNEMIVEPYSGNTFRCPICPTFRTTLMKEMRYHIYKEKEYDRYDTNDVKILIEVTQKSREILIRLFLHVDTFAPCVVYSESVGAN